MGIDPQLLGQGEVEVLHLRTHAKALIAPALVLAVIAIATGTAFALLPTEWTTRGWWILLLISLALVGVGVLPAVLRWWTTTYTFTNRRIITRTGIITQTGHDLPLSRINNVAYRRGPIDRVLGCGSLELTTAADEPVLLKDIPDVERVHVVMTELLFAGEDPIQRPELRDE